jgi:hypothetical protein
VVLRWTDDQERERRREQKEIYSSSSSTERGSPRALGSLVGGARGSSYGRREERGRGALERPSS